MVKNKQSISIVVPVFNEIGNIKEFHQELQKTMSRCLTPYEIIYVDDFSTDGTFEWLESITDSSIKVIRKSGVRGKAFSLIQGFNYATGSVFVMIDGDLQYPPDKIPALVKELQDADVVVANRESYHDGKLRKVLSKGFKHIFGKFLFGLETDVQSGMKAFKREVFETVNTIPVSAWTFDLEFLYRARIAGYVIKNVPITFSERKHGESKVNLFGQVYEIGINALYIKLKRTFYLTIKPEDETMRGAGIGHKKKRYITHTTLPVSMSAIRTFSPIQLLFFTVTPIVLVLLFFAFPVTTARYLVGLLSVLYFIDALFNIFVVLKSFQKDYEIKVTDSELEKIREDKLPVYSILCPLYKEAHVVPQFLEGIAKLDWPKEKLDVMFLLEEDDVETIQAFNAMTLPYYARTVIVPDSQPKTKPKACNYGLTFAKGKFLVIFDAEDMPDPLQLKKAYLAFHKVPENVKCLQAKLSYYNTHQNLLTRFFTAEYALWFDITLPGLQSLNSALPLGGTSNHFETDILRKLQGWDPFNVTEDADLGVRLFQHGYRTAIIESTTYEEATSVSKNWLRQRSRWIKGYMQTYLVHMRNIIPFIRAKGIGHNAIFQLTVGGKILFALLNPVMWLITFLYFADYSVFGSFMKQIYQPPFSYLAVFSWIFGNFIFLYSYMIAIAKRKQWDVAKYIFLIPAYWLMMSAAAVIALYELILKPHYWQKTVHGFHLGKSKQILTTPTPRPFAQPVVQPAYVTQNVRSVPNPSKDFLKTIQKSGTFSFIVRWMPLLAILNVDLILTRLFLSYEDAQVYILISLIGKTVFLLSQFGANLITPFATRNKSSKAYLYRLIFFTFLFNWIGFVAFGLEGNFVFTSTLGARFASVVPYMSYYLFGILCFNIAYRLTTNNYFKKQYAYTVITLAAITLEVPFFYLHHDSISEVVIAFAYIGSINLITLVMFEMSVNLRKILDNNIISLFKLFEKPAKLSSASRSNIRVLIFNWRDIKHRYAGGAEVYVHELAKRWVEGGNIVTLFCGNDNNRQAYERIDGIEIYRRGGTYTVYLFAFVYYAFKFRGKYDVIIDCENGIPFFTPLFAREQIILLIHHVHQEIFHNFLIFPLNYIAQILEGKLMPLAYQNKNIVTVSNSSQRDIVKLGFTKEKNIQIIPNGVDNSLYVSYPKTDNPSFIYLGRLKEYKNIDIAIKAFAKVVKIKSQAALSIVGNGESYFKLKKLVSELGIENSVTFYGRVSEEEKAKLLAQSWAAIQPSQMEGWGITVIEANAAGTPVIASQVSGLQDSVINGLTGLLVPSGNVTKFANAMMEIADDDTLRMNLSQEALLWAKNFDWNKSASVFYNLIGQNFGEGILQPNYSEVMYSAIENNV
jgi:cellulose synthase/poly-beta-1,6-N-acetylglucosamine synthase-like glycosyltransferase/glycosyltransferase involved in cell wall biosynthesis